MRRGGERQVAPAHRSEPLISLPFALAFLTGYGIDILFNALDKLQRAVLVPTSRHR